MLVSPVARLVRLPHQTPTAECDGDPAQTPEADAVLDQPEGATRLLLLPTTTAATTTLATPTGETIEGLTVRTIAQGAIVDSKGEAGLTGLSHAQQQQQQYLLPERGERNAYCWNAGRDQVGDRPHHRAQPHGRSPSGSQLAVALVLLSPPRSGRRSAPHISAAGYHDPTAPKPSFRSRSHMRLPHPLHTSQLNV